MAAKPKRVYVARDYIVLEDGTRYEKGDRLPPEAAETAAESHVTEKK